METVLSDVRYGLRLLARAPGFTLVTLIALAVGIGANTTIVSVANALLLRPPAVHDPERVVRIHSNRFSASPLPDALDYGRATRTLEGVGIYRARGLSFRIGQGAPEPLTGQMVSGDYFDLLGVRAAAGRTFLPSEGRAPGSSPVAVLSDRYWRNRLHADTSIIGRDILINGHAFTVVGVMPPSFRGVMGPLTPDVWIPIMMEPVLNPGSDLFTNRGGGAVEMIGRLRPGATLAQAQAELSAINQELQRTFPATNQGRAVTAYRLTMMPPEMLPAVGIFVGLLFTLSAIVLLIACLNVANLLLARSTSRVSELGIRLAIGAGRGRLVRQLLTESALLAIGGGALGMLLAWWLTRLLNGWEAPAAAPMPIVLDFTPDWRVLIATTVVSLLSALLFGLAPALSASRGAVMSSLRRDTARGTGGGRSRLRAGFLIAQVSLSLVLLVVSALLVRSLAYAGHVDIGFKQDQVLSLTLNPAVRQYTPEQGRAFYRDLLEQVRALPGVRAAHVLDIVPLTLSNRSGRMMKEGQTQPPQDRERAELPMVYQNSIGPGHFHTLQIPLLAGRDFNERDTSTSTRVGIINETLARRFWPGESAIGKRLRGFSRDPNQAPPYVEVIGVVRDSKYATIGEEQRPFLYRAIDQEQEGSDERTLLVRVDGAPAAFARPIQQVLQRIDPDLPARAVGPLTEATGISLVPIRLAASFLSVLGLLVLGLAAVGLYGVLSFLVRLRTKEIGIRVALGADRARVLRTIMSDALRWVAWGLGLGLALAAALTPLVSTLLYGVPPHDWLTFLGVSALLTAVGAAAAALPALRASRIDPLAALRTE